MESSCQGKRLTLGKYYKRIPTDTPFIFSSEFPFAYAQAHFAWKHFANVLANEFTGRNIPELVKFKGMVQSSPEGETCLYTEKQHKGLGTMQVPPRLSYMLAPWLWDSFTQKTHCEFIHTRNMTPEIGKGSSYCELCLRSKQLDHQTPGTCHELFTGQLQTKTFSKWFLTRNSLVKRMLVCRQLANRNKGNISWINYFINHQAVIRILGFCSWLDHWSIVCLHSNQRCTCNMCRQVCSSSLE